MNWESWHVGFTGIISELFQRSRLILEVHPKVKVQSLFSPTRWWEVGWGFPQNSKHLDAAFSAEVDLSGLDLNITKQPKKQSEVGAGARLWAVGVNNVFSNQSGISGLPETSITQDVTNCMEPFYVFLLVSPSSSVVSDCAATLFCYFKLQKRSADFKTSPVFHISMRASW